MSKKKKKLKPARKQNGQRTKNASRPRPVHRHRGSIDFEASFDYPRAALADLHLR